MDKQQHFASWVACTHAVQPCQWSQAAHPCLWEALAHMHLQGMSLGRTRLHPHYPFLSKGTVCLSQKEAELQVLLGDNPMKGTSQHINVKCMWWVSVPATALTRCSSDVHSKITCFMSIKCFLLSLGPFVSLASLLSLQLRVPCDCYYSTLPFVRWLDQPVGIIWWSWLRSRLQWLSDNWRRVPAWEILGGLSMGDTQECSAEIRCAATVQAASRRKLRVASSAGHTTSCAVQ